MLLPCVENLRLHSTHVKTFCNWNYRTDGRGGTVPTVTKRTAVVVASPTFGEWLEKLRGQRSLEAIARKLRVFLAPTGLKVGPSLLFRVEQGRVPSWPMLFGLAAVYEIPVATMAIRLVREIYFPGARDLIRHAGERKSNLPPDSEVAVDPAAARVRELETRIEELEMYRLVVEELRPVLADVFELADRATTLVGGKGDQAAAAPTGRRRNPRKAG